MSAWQQLKGQWSALKHARPGERFCVLYEKNRNSGSTLMRWLAPLAALLCVAIGVVLAFIPGPAVLFFALAAGLIAMQSRWVAGRLDRAELAARALWRKVRRRRRR